VTACVRVPGEGGGRRQDVRTFSSTTRGLLTGVLAGGGFLGFFYVSFRAGLSIEHRSGGPNALWLANDWVDSPHSAGDYARLAQMLQRNGITDGFFHIGPMTGRGTISRTRYRYARTLVRTIHTLDPDLLIQAWIGQVQTTGRLLGPSVQVNIGAQQVNVAR